MCFVVVLLASPAEALDTLHMQDGVRVEGRIEGITHKTISLRIYVDLGKGQRGEVKRRISLAKVNYIEFGSGRREKEILKEGVGASIASLRKLWDHKATYLAQPRSNTGEVGLLLAKALLQTDSVYQWKDAMALYDLIEEKSWNEKDQVKARIGRMHGLVIQGRLKRCEVLARDIIKKNQFEVMCVEAHLVLGKIAFLRLKEVQEDNPRWQEDEEMRSRFELLCHESLDHFLDAYLFHPDMEDAAVRGLMEAAALYRFLGEDNKARECIEDAGQIMPEGLALSREDMQDQKDERKK